jgi:hypothetical protein
VTEPRKRRDIINFVLSCKIPKNKMSLKCPDDVTAHNLVEINDLMNGFEGDGLNAFAHEYSRFRDTLLRS